MQLATLHCRGQSPQQRVSQFKLSIVPRLRSPGYTHIHKHPHKRSTRCFILQGAPCLLRHATVVNTTLMVGNSTVTNWSMRGSRETGTCHSALCKHLPHPCRARGRFDILISLLPERFCQSIPGLPQLRHILK